MCRAVLRHAMLLSWLPGQAGPARAVLGRSASRMARPSQTRSIVSGKKGAGFGCGLGDACSREQADGSIQVANVAEMSAGACDWCVRDARIARAGAVLVLTELVGHGGHDWSAGEARKWLGRQWCVAGVLVC